MNGSPPTDTSMLRKFIGTPEGRAAAQLSLYRRDFRRLAAEQLRVKTKPPNPRVVLMSPLLAPQEEFLRSVERQKEELGDIVRQVWLKARQQGGSTLAEALTFHRAGLSPNINALTVANDKPTAENLFRIIKLFHESLDPAIRPKTRYNCVDELTECLSRRGWLRWDQLSVRDEIYSLDPESGEGCWTKVRNIYANRDYCGPMLRWMCQDIDACATPDHRWIVTSFRRRGRPPGISSPGSGGRRVPRNRYSIVEGREMRRTYLLPKAAPLRQEDGPISDAALSLLGWTVAEGCFSVLRETKIGQSYKVNPSKVEAIRSLLVGLRAQWGEYPNRKKGAITFGIRGAWNTFLRHTLPEKRFSWEFIASLSARQARIVLDALIAGDGYTNGRTQVYWTADRILAEQVQAIATVAGVSARIFAGGKQRPNRRRAIARYGDMCGVGLHAISTAMAEPLLRTQCVQEYTGTIWCPETDTGLWLARRGNRVYFTGNTKRDLTFEDESEPDAGLRSSYMVDTANNVDVGVSRTITMLHLSEVARYGKAEKAISSVLGSIPLVPGTSIIMESTAYVMGAYFKSMVERARRQEGAWRFCFVPWTRSPEYSMALAAR